jgi:hypothetical protein
MSSPISAISMSLDAKGLASRGIHVRLSTKLTTAVKKDKTGVVVSITKRTPVSNSHSPVGGDPKAREWEEEYDEIVLGTL